MPFVLDASVTMAWCFADEANPYTESVLDRLRETEAVVPMIWPLEVANVLLTSERRGRLTEAQSGRFLQLLQAAPIIVDEGTVSDAMGDALELGRKHQLSVYDACYLQLALRRGLSLATLDAELRTAAHQAGVNLVV